MGQLRQLERFNISFNIISEIDTLKNLSTNVNMKEIQLLGNPVIY